jgi:hypothetical protein
MATVHVRFGSVMGEGAPVYAPIPKTAATITSSASSQATTIAAEDSDYLTVTTSGGAVFIAIGQNPTAASGRGDLLPDGSSKDFGPLKTGDKVAVIDA